MKTNDIKKGTKVQLRNGWEAIIEDNQRGNTRMATVHGVVTEMGSVYSHDIVRVQTENGWKTVEHTPAQKKLLSTVNSFF